MLYAILAVSGGAVAMAIWALVERLRRQKQHIGLVRANARTNFLKRRVDALCGAIQERDKVTAAQHRQIDALQQMLKRARAAIPLLPPNDLMTFFNEALDRLAQEEDGEKADGD